VSPTKLDCQPIPIPSYLLAIASGNLTYRAFPRYDDKQWTSGIWAEPELIDSSYWEFSEDTARLALTYLHYIACEVSITFRTGS